MVRQRQTQVGGQARGAADGQDGAAGFEELAQLRDGGRRGDGAALFLHAAIGPGRLVSASTSASAAPTAGATPAAATTEAAAGDGAIHEDDHIVLLTQTALVQLRCIDDLEWELETLQQPARPARGHRAAVTVPQA